MERRRLLLAGGVAALLVGAFMLSRCSEQAEIANDPERAAAEAARKKPKERVRYPRDRIRRASDSPLATERAKTPKQAAAGDPILRAMAAPDGSGAIFAEVNAIRHSPLVEKILRCREKEAMAGLDDLKRMTGVDVLEDVDRLALGNGTAAISGFFDDLKTPEGVTQLDSYGDGAELFEYAEDGGKPGYYAKVGDELIVAAESVDQLKASIDRIEGRGPADTAVPPTSTNSEVYGRVGAAFIAGLLKGSDDPMAQQIQQLVDGGVVRLNVGEHVSASFDVETNDPSAGRDLAKTIGAGLAMWRRDAEQKGDHELATLLEQARVMPKDDGSFGLDLAVPGDSLLSMMGCE